ncbi:MAG TPA: hypothetical protein VGI10_16950 [Polyangiaceae bacterium]|jgi:flagellar protein FlgJ
MTPLAAVGPTPATTESAQAPDPRVVKAARDFEAIFVRQMLRSLEKTTSLGTGHAAAGSSTYGSMVVNAMSEAVSSAGGLGLSDVLVKSFAAAHPGAGRPAVSAAPAQTGPAKTPK